MSKKALASLTLACMLVVSLIVGGATLALFTGTTTNADNNFTAGTINLIAERNYGDYLPGPVFYPNSLDPDGQHPYDANVQNPSGESMGGWAPGDSVSRLMRIKNTGTLDAKLSGLKATPRVTFTHNTPWSGQRTVNGLITGAAYDEFIQKANVIVKNGSVLLYDGPLSNLIFNTPNTYAPVLNEIVVQAPPPSPFTGGFQNIEIEVTLDKTAGNVLQGETFIFDIGFYAEQLRNNETTSNNEIRIELTWSGNVDLDAHLTGPNDSGNRFHVFYDNKNYFESSNLHANLDTDFLSSPGPEIIRINNPKNPGMYRYSVHKFSGQNLSASGAQVKVYENNNLVSTFNVPTSHANNINLWTVFEIQNGQIVPINSMTQTTGSGIGIQSSSVPANDAYLMENLPEKD